MKKILYIILLTVLSISISAQTDRNVQPKPGPAPKINLGKPQKFILPNGLTVLVVENHKLPRVAFSLTLDNPPSLEGDIKGVDYLAGAMMGNGTSKISKDDFNNKIDFYGAYADFDLHNTSGTTLSRYFPEVLELVSQGILDPLFTQAELDSERAKLIDGLKTQEKNAQYIAKRVRKTLLYGQKHPEGEIVTEESINKITLADIEKYYCDYFVPENAYLVIVGDVKFSDVKNLVKNNFSSWKKASAPKSIYSDPINLSTTEINFVDVPNAVQSEISVNNLISLKMSDPDYFAALLANQILGGGAEGRLFLNLREGHGWTYGSYSDLQGDKYISDFSGQASVRNVVTDSAIVEMLGELKKINATLPTQAELDLAKAKYIGNFVMNAEKPQTIASFALNENTQKLPTDFYQNYIKNINAVTLAQVQAAAKKYILHDKTRIVVVGKAAEVLPSLEKLNIPIKYFDKYGTPTDKPKIKTSDTTITAQSVLNKYISIIGGEKALKGVHTLSTIIKGIIMDQEISISTKMTNDGKMLQEVSVMGMVNQLFDGNTGEKLAPVAVPMVIAKQLFDGNTGYISAQGQKRFMTEAELSDMSNGIFPELKLLNSPDLQLISVEKINDSDAYKIQKGKKAFFYDVNSGLKVAEETTYEANGQSITMRSYFSNYKEYKGIKFPYTLSMNMMGIDVEFTTTDIKINEGVSNMDFK